MSLLATATVVGLNSTAMAGSSNSYATPQQETSVTTFTAAAPPVLETYTSPAPVYAPIETAPVKDGFYNETRYGGNAELGYEQSHACGGVLDGEKCLVILSDHMRRVRLDQPAGTILVGNPLIADVTVLGNDTLFVSARSVGSTNIIVLDRDGNEIVTYEAFVREPRTKRVTLRNAGEIESYQCAPYCERTLSQSDSAAPFQTRAGIIGADLGLDQRAIALQSGPNPNTDPAALNPSATQQQQQQQAPAAIAVPLGGGGGSSAAAPGSGAALGASIGALAQQTNSAVGLIGGVTGLLGGGAPAAPSGPARTDAPPLPGGFN